MGLTIHLPSSRCIGTFHEQPEMALRGPGLGNLDVRPQRPRPKSLSRTAKGGVAVHFPPRLGGGYVYIIRYTERGEF